MDIVIGVCLLIISIVIGILYERYNKKINHNNDITKAN